jgi:hypothetical protein
MTIDWFAAWPEVALHAVALRILEKHGTMAEADRDVVRLRHEVAHWRGRAERAELVLEIEKKVDLLLGTTLPDEKVRA